MRRTLTKDQKRFRKLYTMSARCRDGVRTRFIPNFKVDNQFFPLGRTMSKAESEWFRDMLAIAISKIK